MQRNTEHPFNADALGVVCLCAAWCNTCTAYRAVFDAVAGDWPGVRFDWVDIEDEADLVDDLDVETFPTILVGRGEQALFLGALLPHQGVLERLVQSLADAKTPAPGSAGAEAQEIWKRIQAAPR